MRPVSWSACSTLSRPYHCTWLCGHAHPLPANRCDWVTRWWFTTVVRELHVSRRKAVCGCRICHQDCTLFYSRIVSQWCHNCLDICNFTCCIGERALWSSANSWYAFDHREMPARSQLSCGCARPNRTKFGRYRSLDSALAWRWQAGLRHHATICADLQWRAITWCRWIGCQICRCLDSIACCRECGWDSLGKRAVPVIALIPCGVQRFWFTSQQSGLCTWHSPGFSWPPVDGAVRRSNSCVAL